MKRKPTSRDMDLPLVERAYLAFAGASRPVAMEHSPYRDPLWIKRMEMIPKRDISDDDIHYYAGTALTTVGNGEDYRYFMPRLLEAVVNDKVVHAACVIVDRLEMAGWTAWSAEEREIVLEVAELAAAREAVKFARYLADDPWGGDEAANPENWIIQLQRLKAMPVPRPEKGKRR